jgi:hypothetical protein
MSRTRSNIVSKKPNQSLSRSWSRGGSLVRNSCSAESKTRSSNSFHLSHFAVMGSQESSLTANDCWPRSAILLDRKEAEAKKSKRFKTRWTRRVFDKSKRPWSWTNSGSCESVDTALEQFSIRNETWRLNLATEDNSVQDAQLQTSQLQLCSEGHFWLHGDM